MRQAWKSLKRKIFKPAVFFLDNATLAERMFIIRHIKPTLNGMDFDDVLSQPHLVVTNLSRKGERLDYYLVRCSRCNTHFYSRDCYKGALVYGESDWIGPLEDMSMSAITTMMRRQMDEEFFRPVPVIRFDGQTPIDFCMNINEEGQYNWRDASTATEVLSQDKVKIGELK